MQTPEQYPPEPIGTERRELAQPPKEEPEVPAKNHEGNGNTPSDWLGNFINPVLSPVMGAMPFQSPREDPDPVRPDNESQARVASPFNLVGDLQNNFSNLFGPNN
mmetsp:Transcript_37332/g.58318  ORF Transcript_37332/g.58318 Transcript_37332/m.58318 type:complete len:105 (+) Transcript_37332:529-843(+)